MIAEPPLETGAVHVITELATRTAVAFTEVGAPGAAAATGGAAAAGLVTPELTIAAPPKRSAPVSAIRTNLPPVFVVFTCPLSLITIEYCSAGHLFNSVAGRLQTSFALISWLDRSQFTSWKRN